MLEHAVGFDPHNEGLCREIMRLHHRLGRPSAAARTLDALTARLAEIDAKPDPRIIAAAAGRQPAAPPAPAGAGAKPAAARRSTVGMDSGASGGRKGTIAAGPASSKPTRS